MEYSFLVTSIHQNTELCTIVNFDAKAHTCHKYFKGDLQGLLKNLPDIVDEGEEDIKNIITTDEIPCAFCNKSNCCIRDHYSVIPENIVNNIFLQFAEAKKDDIKSYVGED